MTVNVIENAQSDTFKAPCCCFENAPNTALTIVCTINVSIDCKENKVSIKAPCCCFENAPNTALTIVCTINVSIDCKKNKVSNLNQEKNILDCKSRQQVAWFVFCFKIKLCVKMMFSLLLQLQIHKSFVP